MSFDVKNKVQLDDNSYIFIETASLGGEEEVSFNVPKLSEVQKQIESVSKMVLETIKKVSPQKAKVEFGVQIGVESGSLTTVLVKGTGNANLKITLEWEKE